MFECVIGGKALVEPRIIITKAFINAKNLTLSEVTYLIEHVAKVKTV